MTSWHRWVALEGVNRSTGKAITGAANLGFLFIVLSGMYLWLPRVWTRLQFTQVLWFRRGLPAKARDFTWHNVVGIWSAVPLAIVVAGAVPISSRLFGHLTSPSQAVLRKELSEQLDMALASMDDLDREVLALRHFEELSNRETARVLNLSEQAASMRYVRALNRLQNVLKAIPGFGEMS